MRPPLSPQTQWNSLRHIGDRAALVHASRILRAVLFAGFDIDGLQRLAAARARHCEPCVVEGGHGAALVERCFIAGGVRSLFSAKRTSGDAAEKHPLFSGHFRGSIAL